MRGFTGGQGATNTDSGNLNYDKGDTFSQVVKFTTDLSISKGDSGALIRAKGWYDREQKKSKVRFGNQGQRPYYTPNAPLSDEGLALENRFNGVRLMDAYGFTEFKLGENPLQVRLGSQVVNWGESLFLQGVNQTSPIDVPALRRGAGTEIKEFLVPVQMAYGNLGLGGGKSIEAFYQLKWERTTVDACGTYFAPAENAVSNQIGRCDIATTFGGGSNTANLAAGRFFNIVDGRDARNEGQYGVAFRFPVAAIDTEFGVYYQKLHSRMPIISVLTGQGLPAGAPALFLPGPTANALKAVWEYPEDQKIFGVSAATNILGWSMGFEASHMKDVAAQINGNDLVAGFLQGVGPVGLEARTLAGRIAGTPAAALRTMFHGYDKFNKTQFQFNGVKLYSNILGAQNLTVIGEAGFQWNNVPDYKNGGRRYGRGFIFGNGTSSSIAGGANLCAVPVASGGNPQPDGCKNDGYVTDFSYGIRARAALTYNDVFGSGITAIPSLFWGRDIKGVSIDPQFNEGRDTLSTGLKLDYNKQYSMDIGYVRFGNSAKWDLLRDRDFYSISMSATF